MAVTITVKRIQERADYTVWIDLIQNFKYKQIDSLGSNYAICSD